MSLRTVHAVLIGADQVTDWPRVAAARDAVATMEPFLANRLELNEKVVVSRFSPDALITTLTSAVEASAATLGAGDLFILMFSGHGDGEHEGMAFDDGLLLDKDLAALLGKLPPVVEVVVIADCCYATVIFDFGNLADLVKKRAEAFMQTERSAQLVFVAAAKTTLQHTGPTSEFVRVMCEATPLAGTYSNLVPTMKLICPDPEEQSNWVLLGRPDQLLEQEPIAPEVILRRPVQSSC